MDAKKRKRLEKAGWSRGRSESKGCRLGTIATCSVAAAAAPRLRRGRNRTRMAVACPPLTSPALAFQQSTPCVLPATFELSRRPGRSGRARS